MELRDYRAQIDAIDTELVQLFAARMDVAAEIAAYKQAHGLPVLQPTREREKLDTLRAQVQPALQPYLTELYRVLFSLSRRYQEARQRPLRCGLLGERLGHSYSPRIHKLLGGYSYELFEVKPEDLGTFLKTAPFDGLNVTIPYKQAVLPYCAALSEAAQRVGSVNTILRRPDGSLYGDNTDYAGFLWLLERNGGIRPGEKALVLGSGGASLTVQAALHSFGADVVVLSRRGPRDYDSLSLHADAALVVNTTPVGMYPDNGQGTIDLDLLPNCRCVLDLIYNPARTRLLLDAEARNIPCEGGLPMLVCQAKCAAERFTGRAIPAERREEILCQLQQEMENIIFIGMPGCGKTTLGRALAEALGRPFFDTDEEIVKAIGCDIPAWFAREGEAAFRQVETAVLAELGKGSGAVIATGGGCVTRPENYPLLHQNGRIVWLQRSLSELPRAGRPISEAADLQELYAQRRGLYGAFADLTVENCGEKNAVVEAILSTLYLK